MNKRRTWAQMWVAKRDASPPCKSKVGFLSIRSCARLAGKLMGWALAATAAACAYAQQLAPGIYHRLPHTDQAREATNGARSVTHPNGVERHEFRSAFADDGSALFALVAWDATTHQGSAVFAPVNPPSSTPRTACKAYALAGDSHRLSQTGFCPSSPYRPTPYEPRFEAIGDGFLMEWEPVTRVDSTETVPAQRPPDI